MDGLVRIFDITMDKYWKVEMKNENGVYIDGMDGLVRIFYITMDKYWKVEMKDENGVLNIPKV